MHKNLLYYFRPFLLYTLSVINLLFMHEYLRRYGGEGVAVYPCSICINVLVTVLDVSIVALMLVCLTKGKVKLSLSMVYLISWLWSFVNVIYIRFFYHYLPTSTISQISSLTDGLVIDSVLASLKWIDFFYVVSFIVFLGLVKKRFYVQRSLKMVLCFILLPVLSFFLIFLILTIYHFSNPYGLSDMKSYESMLSNVVWNPQARKKLAPDETVYHAGVIRILVSDIYDQFVQKKLSDEERDMIYKEYSSIENRVSGHVTNPQVKNVLFLVLESFLSASSDLIIDGKEITPFLNSLKQDPTVYYNGHVLPNITLGESGDGQFIYMTGLLPLRNKITVGEAKTKVLPALPKILKKDFGIKYTEIVLPTNIQMWQQESMNIVYGIDKTYQNVDFGNNWFTPINDNQVFKLSELTNKEKYQPFFSMTLSIDTHYPYGRSKNSSLFLSDKNYSESFKNYMCSCHNVDQLIKSYFDYLKATQIYDNSLIVIVSDHHAHIDALDMGDKISNETPLYIINGNVDKTSSWSGRCNQLDVFTTILDVLNIDSNWRGLGHTLLTPNYVTSVTSNTWDISELIIEGDFFRGKL